jgi:hypothetical protein
VNRKQSLFLFWLRVLAPDGDGSVQDLKQIFVLSILGIRFRMLAYSLLGKDQMVDG